MEPSRKASLNRSLMTHPYSDPLQIVNEAKKTISAFLPRTKKERYIRKDLNCKNLALCIIIPNPTHGRKLLTVLTQNPTLTDFDYLLTSNIHLEM